MDASLMSNVPDVLAAGPDVNDLASVQVAPTSFCSVNAKVYGPLPPDPDAEYPKVLSQSGDRPTVPPTALYTFTELLVTVVVQLTFSVVVLSPSSVAAVSCTVSTPR